MIWIQNQLIGAYEGQQLTLECHSEAYPKSINYWAKGEIIAQGECCIYFLKNALFRHTEVSFNRDKIYNYQGCFFVVVFFFLTLYLCLTVEY